MRRNRVHQPTPQRSNEQVQVIHARQVLLMFALAFGTFCLFIQIAKSFL